MRDIIKILTRKAEVLLLLNKNYISATDTTDDLKHKTTEYFRGNINVKVFVPNVSQTQKLKSNTLIKENLFRVLRNCEL